MSDTVSSVPFHELALLTSYNLATGTPIGASGVGSHQMVMTMHYLPLAGSAGIATDEEAHARAQVLYLVLPEDAVIDLLNPAEGLPDLLNYYRTHH